MNWTFWFLFYLLGHFSFCISVEYLEVTKCYGGFFMEDLCPSGLVMNVQGAVFGVSKCNTDARQCCPDPGDCVLDVQQTEIEYFRAIKRACNGRRRCGFNLRADWTSARTCDPLVPTTDYVTLFYTCSSYNGRTPLIFYPSTTVPSLISSLSTIFATEFPEGISNIATSSEKTTTALSGGTLAGIIAAAVSGLILIILLAIYCIRTREPGWAETFNDGIDDMKHKKEIKYLTSNDSQMSSGDKEKKVMSDNGGALNPGFTPERETPRYIRPTQPPPAVIHPYYTGAEVVKTPQQAINMMDDHYKDEEDTYDVIDDVLSRFTPSTGSIKKKSFRTLSVPVSRSDVSSSTTDGKASVRKTTSHTGIEKVSINDQIYYSPFSTNQALPPSSANAPRTPSRAARLSKKAASFGAADEAYYNEYNANANKGNVRTGSRDEMTYQGLSLHAGSHSYETMSPSPQPGRSLISGNTTYSLVNDPEHDLYYSDVITGVHNFHHDDNTYSDVEL